MNNGTNKQQPHSGIHDTSVHVCTKFHPPRPHSSSEKCDEKL